MILAIVVIILSMGATGYMFYEFKKEIEESKRQIYVMDYAGNIFFGQVERMNLSHRVAEYKDHVRDFYNLWYSFDQNTFYDNTDRALWLIGERGKELKEEYEMQKVYENVFEKNMIVNVEVLNIDIDVNQRPMVGIIEGIQTIRRGMGEIRRNLVVEFSITDAQGRSEKNPHGAVIKKWNVIDKSPIENE
jgi:hypothetical protein